MLMDWNINPITIFRIDISMTLRKMLFRIVMCGLIMALQRMSKAHAQSGKRTQRSVLSPSPNGPTGAVRTQRNDAGPYLENSECAASSLAQKVAC